MSLFVVQHQHAAERCPAQDPQMAPMLLKHLAPENAARQGVKIEGEAVINNAHTLYMILDAPDQATVDRYMEPFAQAGSVSVLPASSCVEVVERGGCAL